MPKLLKEEYFTADGRERPSNVPARLHVRQPVNTEVDRIRELIRSERLRQEAEAAGHESFEEADDFDIGDDFDPSSPYEEAFEGQYDPHPPLVLDSPKGDSPPAGGASFDGEAVDSRAAPSSAQAVETASDPGGSGGQSSKA